MKKTLLVTLALFLSGFTNHGETSTYTEYNAETIKVAVIDTGFDFESTWPKEKFEVYALNNSWFGKKPSRILRPRLCNQGHKDFTGSGVQDSHGHGTHIAGLIGKYAENSNYCLVIIKYFSATASGPVNLAREIKAFQYALNIKVDIINFSGGGPSFNNKEHEVIKKLLARGTKLVFAAGNESQNIDDPRFKYYPASYSPKIFTVGSQTRQLKKAPSSNYGEYINSWEIGDNVLSILPKNRYGNMSGTSQATAVKTGKTIKNWVTK